MRRSRESAPMRALLVLTALQAYWSVRADATPMQLDPLVNALGRLLGRNWNDEIDRPDPLPQALRLLAAHIEIDQRFCREGLSPTSVAEALGISVRQLHRLFERGGESFAQVVMRKRLDLCRKFLEASAHADLSISEIAFKCGFESLPTFYRNFRQRFGTTPREARDLALHETSSRARSLTGPNSPDFRSTEWAV